MRISYIFPQFLLPTQAFALSDILALREAGHEVIVHTIKPAHGNQDALDRQYGVPTDLPVMRPALRGAARWPAIAWRSRAILALLAGRILRNTAAHPQAALTALLSLPRCAEIAGEISMLRPDVVHLFWSRHASLVFPFLAKQRNTATRSAFVGAYDLVADDFLTSMAIDGAEVLFTHAEVNRQFVADRAPPATPLHVIHRGIPFSGFGRGSAERDDTLWVTASALDRSKNVEGVIRTFARSRTAAPDLRLGIYGDGPDRSRLEALARSLVPTDAIRFHGHVDRSALMAQMRRAQLFLLLSKKPSERLPNVVKEAMLAGCGIVVSRSEGIEELIVGDDLGKVIDADDDRAIDCAIAEIAGESGAAAHARRTAARQFIERKFSTAESMQSYCTAWEQARTDRLAMAGEGRSE